MSESTEPREDMEEVEGHARPRPLNEDLDAEVEGHARPRPLNEDDDPEVEGHARPRP